MSRPFSYNDENFTVIGNILFVHFRFNKAIVADTPITIRVPDAIRKRMVSTGNYFVTSPNEYGNNGYFVYGSITSDGYFIFGDNRSISNVDRYFYTWYLLKDI